LRELREKKKKKEKEEEERRGNEVETLPNRDRDQSLCCFLFCVLRAAVD